jgi:hypothetical protein
MIGETSALASSDDENMPRDQCKSVVTGTMNTLVVKMTAGPGPTMLPISDAATIHQRFCKADRLSMSPVLATAHLPDKLVFLCLSRLVKVATTVNLEFPALDHHVRVRR